MKAEINTQVNFTVKCELTENELRALDALVGYGLKPFLIVFYQKLGMHYMEPFERDLKQLFEKIESLRPELSKIDKARKDLGIDKSNRIKLGM